MYSISLYNSFLEPDKGMMLLLLTTLNQEGNYQAFNIGGPELELLFDIVHLLVKSDCTLLTVDLIVSNGQPMALPPELFDGQSLRKPLEALQQSWEQLLKDNQ